MPEQRDIRIRVPVLARVEGEGALRIDVLNGRIDNLELRIYEPPRMFEKLLEGRSFEEVPDIVSRICGICPIAYQMNAVIALEQALKTDVDHWVKTMREALYCGEWIQSHALHIHLLAAPDFLGFPSIVEMAREHPALVRRGLRLQALGNDIIRLFGGRSVHPVGVCVGGFYRAPALSDVTDLYKRLVEARKDAEDLLEWALGLSLPDVDQDVVFVSLRHPETYPMSGGRIISNRGLDIEPEDFESHVKEFQVPHSTALHALLNGEPYFVGPLARLNLNLDRLPGDVLDRIEAAGIPLPSKNPFHSLIARSVEIILSIDRAASLLNKYLLPETPFCPVKPNSGLGISATEAPRGLLWHRYELDKKGQVKSARIVPPTSQNQARIEADLRLSLENFGLEKPDSELRQYGEQIIRNYDPCISCATHFLHLNVNRNE